MYRLEVWLSLAALQNSWIDKCFENDSWQKGVSILGETIHVNGISFLRAFQAAMGRETGLTNVRNILAVSN